MKQSLTIDPFLNPGDEEQFASLPNPNFPKDKLPRPEEMPQWLQDLFNKQANQQWLKSHKPSKYNPHHDPHTGRFTSGSGSGTGQTGEGLRLAVQSTGGFTYQPHTQDSPKDGVAFSPYPERGKVVPAASLTAQDIEDFQDANDDLLSKPDHYLGAWLNNDDGMVYLDISVVTQDKSAGNVQALLVQYDQLAGYDLGAGKEIQRVGATVATPAAAASRQHYPWSCWPSDSRRSGQSGRAYPSSGGGSGSKADASKGKVK